MPATSRKTAADTVNVPAGPRRRWPNPQLGDRSRERRAARVASDSNGTTSSAAIANEAATRSQPGSVKDIRKLRNSDATPPPSIPARPSTAESSGTPTMTPTITPVIAVWIIDISPYMGRIITTAVVVGIVIVDATRSYRQVNPDAADRTFDLQPVIAG